MKGYLLCAGAMTVLGGSVAISRSILAYAMLTGQALRYSVAAVVLLIMSRGGVPAGGQLLRLGAIAATGLVGFNVCLLTALRHADAAVVGTIVGGSPLVLAIAGPLAQRVRPAPRLVVAAGFVVLGPAALATPMIMKDSRRYDAPDPSRSWDSVRRTASASASAARRNAPSGSSP